MTYYTLSSGTVGNALVRGALLRGVRNTIKNEASNERALTYVPLTLNSGWESAIDLGTLRACSILVSDIPQPDTVAVPSVPELLRSFRVDSYQNDEHWIATQLDEHTLRLWFSGGDEHKAHLQLRRAAAAEFIESLRSVALTYLAAVEDRLAEDKAKNAVSAWRKRLETPSTDTSNMFAVANLLRTTLQQDPVPGATFSEYSSNSAFSGAFSKPHMFLFGTCVTLDVEIRDRKDDDDGWGSTYALISLTNERDLSLLLSNQSADLDRAFLEWFDMRHFQETLERSVRDRSQKNEDRSLLVSLRYLLTDAVTVYLADSASRTASVQAQTEMTLQQLRATLSSVFSGRSF